MEFLLDSGAKPNVQDPVGNTPLHLVGTEKRERDMYRLLSLFVLSYGALSHVCRSFGSPVSSSVSLSSLFFFPSSSPCASLSRSVCLSSHRSSITHSLFPFRLLSQEIYPARQFFSPMALILVSAISLRTKHPQRSHRNNSRNFPRFFEWSKRTS